MLQGISLDMVSNLEVEPPMEVEPPLEVAAGDGLGQAKHGKGRLEMGPGQGLEERGSWMGYSWRRDHGAWRCPISVCVGRHQERLLWHMAES